MTVRISRLRSVLGKSAIETLHYESSYRLSQNVKIEISPEDRVNLFRNGIDKRTKPRRKKEKRRSLKISPEEWREVVLSGDFWGTSKVAKVLNIGKKATITLFGRGNMPAIKIYGRWVVPKAVVLSFAEHHLSKGRNTKAIEAAWSMAEELIERRTGGVAVEWLGTKEAAERVGVHPETLRKRIRKGELSAKRLGGKLLVLAADLE